MEFFDICDESGQPTGQMVERSIAHRDGILHRTVHIWVTRQQDGKQQILLQKRSAQKDSFPGMYDTSSAGHIQAGDEPLESAVRELREELGITADVEQFRFIGNFRVNYALEFHGEMFRDDEFVFIYLFQGAVKAEELILQEEEVERVDWFDLEEVWHDCSHGIRDRFCVPTESLEILMRALSGESSGGRA